MMAFVRTIRSRHKRWALDRRGIGTIAHEFVRTGGADGDEQRKTGIVIHGLMGAGKNLRTLAKDLLSTVMQRCPPSSRGWELVLVDLRNHGNSAGLKHLSPPHSIRAAAMDLADLVRSELRKWPDVVIGHSLGGKVALEFGESCANGRFGPSAVNPSQDVEAALDMRASTSDVVGTSSLGDHDMDDDLSDVNAMDDDEEEDEDEDGDADDESYEELECSISENDKHDE
ncbi:hypothetical protein L7F22_034040 [Adiantum nelumboides]|nr:hypothetical protein [Adiantum nelumboides]